MLGIGALLGLVVLKFADRRLTCGSACTVAGAPPILADATAALRNRWRDCWNLEPKVLLFYGAFLPQFIDPGRSLWQQFVVMAASFAVVEFAVGIFSLRLPSHIRPWLGRAPTGASTRCAAGLFARRWAPRCHSTLTVSAPRPTTLSGSHGRSDNGTGRRTSR